MEFLVRGGPVRPLPLDDGTFVAPGIAALEDGGYAVANLRGIERRREADVEVLVQTFDADGTPRGDAAVVGINAGWQFDDPGVLGLPDGRLLVTWQSEDDKDVPLGRILSPDGRPEGDAFRFFDRYSLSGVDLAATAEGFAAVATLSREGPEAGGAHLRLFDADGRPLGEARPLGEGADYVSFQGTEDGLAAWWHDEPGRFSVLDRDVDFVFRFDEEGEATTPPAELRLDGDLLPDRRGLPIPLADDRTLLVYRTDVEDLVVTLSADGRIEGDPTPLGGVGRSSSMDHQAEALPGGDVLVAWAEDSGPDGWPGGPAVFRLQRFDPHGVSRGEPITVVPWDDAEPPVNPELTGLAALDSGRVVLSWQNEVRGDPDARIEGWMVQLSTEADPSAIVGTSGGERLRGSREADVILALGGSDVLQGRRGSDDLLGGDGDDRLHGGRGVDRIEAGPGDDALRGGRGSDALDGGAGDDVLRGGRGHDRLVGGSGDDRMSGGKGRDVIEWGEGHDRAKGGSGADRFVRTERGDHEPRSLVIEDLEARDRIVLDVVLFDDAEALVRHHGRVDGDDIEIAYGDTEIRILGWTDMAAVADAIELAW